MAAHRVNHLEIELAADDVGLAEALIVRISELHERRIAPTLDRVFSELSPPGRLDRIDRLELDLGRIAVDEFDDAFVHKLADAVRSALARALGERASGGRGESSLELLTIFARTGNLPWWSDRADADATSAAASDPVAAALTTLTHESPGELLDLLRELADDPPALARLARHCDDRLLAALVERRWPAAAAELSAATAWLARLLADAVADAPPTQLRHSLLATLARPDVSAPAVVLRTLLADLADALQSNETSLLARLSRTAGRHDLPAVLRELLALTGVPPADDHSAGSDRDALLTYAPEDMLLETLLKAQPSDRPAEAEPAAPARSTDPQPRDLLDPSESGPDAVVADSRSRASLAARSPLGPHASPLAEPAPAPPDALLSPELAEPDDDAPPDALDPRDDALRSPELAEPDDAAPPDALDPRDDALLPPALTEPDAAPPAAPSSPLDVALPGSTTRRPTPRPLPPDVLAARRRALERLDEIYVDDGGLVILWPFLVRFFERVRLLDEQRRFLDEPARTRAIALLEHLVSEDPDPPEFCLPLAKLLCGLAPGEAYALARPLEPELLAEGERLLAAVIAQAPALRDVSTAGLRATFLRRPAVLTTHDGSWLLRVERKPHDILLERFPWSWDWLKLPWMPDPLRVMW